MENINIDKTLLAFFDIQAYSAFISNNSKDHCIEVSEALFKNIKRDSGSFMCDIKLRHWIYSDSIILIPDTEARVLDIPSIDFFISICSVLMFRGLRAGLPLRGAIGAGYFYKNNDVIIGTALVDATTYEKEQNWLGAVITPAALSLIKKFHPSFDKKYADILNFGRFLNRGRIPWKKPYEKEKGISKPRNCFYIKPTMPDPNWRKYLPAHYNDDIKIQESDILYGKG